MYGKVLKGICILSVMLTINVCVLMHFLPGIHENAILAEESKSKLEEDWIYQGQEDVKEESPQVIVETATEIESQIKMEIPHGLIMKDINIRNDYINQMVYISLPTDSGDYFSDYKMSGSSDHISSLTYYNRDNKGVIVIGLDKVYELDVKYEEGGLYMDFLSPHEVYDKVIVVDAGHGGRAAGAVKLRVQEKDINLQLLLALKKVMDDSGENIGVYYTRTDDSNPTFEQRVQLANKADADLFISIHNNSSGSGNFSSLNGTQVLYSQSDKSDLSSEKLSKILLNNLCDGLNSRKVGLLKGDDIYIIRNSEVPVALVEIGFMTNRTELEKLQSEKYQKKTAEALYAGIKEAFEAGY